MKRVSSILPLLIALFVSFVAVPVSAAQPPKEWTVAIFLNADNNLDPFGVEDEQEMAKVGSNNWLNIVTLIDREKGPASYNFIEKGKVTKIQDAGELDMGDYQQLVSFMKWVADNYPAKKYVLTIWNHGSGWKQARRGIVKGISYDDSSNNHITTAQLGTALKEIKKVLGKNIDILNMDACLMQMAEVAYSCSSFVDYIVASEEVEPGKGTPYDDVLKTLKQKSTAETFAKNWVRAFVVSYTKGSQGVEASTQSAIRCRSFAPVIDAINGFAKAAMAGKFSTEFAEALGKVQKFSYPENIDLKHLTTLVQASIKDEAIQTACTKLLTALRGAVIANGSSDNSMANSGGLAIYFPAESTSFESTYKALSFAKDTQWDEMVQDFYGKKSAAQIVKSIEEGDVSGLRNYVAKASGNDREINKFVVGQLNFRIHTEGGLPGSLVEEATNLLKELSVK